MTPETEIVDAALKQIEHDSAHPTRKLAREAVQRHRERLAAYDFDKAPRELKAVMYGAAMRFRRRSWFARLLWWR